MILVTTPRYQSHNEGDSIGDCHVNEHKDEYYATVGHQDVDLGSEGLNI